MDDVELDRALNTALSVSPSPEFVARVRTAIAQEPAAGWAITRWLVPAGVMTLLVMLAIDLTKPGPQPAVTADVPLERHARGDVLLTPAPVEIDAPDPSLRARGVPEGSIGQNAASRPAMAPKPAFEVMISPIDAEAYRRLFASVGSMPYTLSSELGAAAAPEEKTMTAIDIAPIVITPLNDFSNDTGAFQ